APRIAVAVGTRPLAQVVVLMIGFGGPETAGRRHLGYDLVAFGPKQGDQSVSHGTLFGRGVEYLGTILVADVGPLPVLLRRIVDLEKQPGERLVGDPRRIEP